MLAYLPAPWIRHGRWSLISPWNPDGEQLTFVRQGLPEPWIRNCLQWSLAMPTAVSHISHKQGRLISGRCWYPLISLINASGMFQPSMGESYWYSYPLFWWWIYSFETCYILLYVSSFPSLYFFDCWGQPCPLLLHFCANVLGIPRGIFS